MKRVAVIFGGRSGEHEISLMSAASVIGALPGDRFRILPVGITKKGEWFRFEGDPADIESGAWERTAEPYAIPDLKKDADIAFPVLHGPFGEDGTIQGLFEMLDLPYCGCGVLASSAAMDKIVSKQLFLAAGLPVCRWETAAAETIRTEEGLRAEAARLEEALPYPMFVKPANMGSSVGITKAKNRKELEEALRLAVRYDRRILIEEGIECRELETGVLGNFGARAAAVGEIVPSAEFYDYHAKYFDGGKTKLCIPAELEASVEDEIRKLAVAAYEAIDGAGFARVDFFREKGSGRLFVNEINTIPGFTRFSLFPLLWKQRGLEYPALLERIIELGYERYYAQNNR